MWVAHSDCLSGCTIELGTDTHSVHSKNFNVNIIFLCQTHEYGVQCIETVAESFNTSYLFSNVLLPVTTRSSADTDKTARRV